jgi:hypothetical protein
VSCRLIRVWQSPYCSLRGVFVVENFTCRLSDGTVQELIPNGRSEPITPLNYKRWIQLCIESRLSESSRQLASFMGGLASVVPMHAFALFTPQELDWFVKFEFSFFALSCA